MIKKIQLVSVLDVDAMFFHSAINNCSIAKNNKNISDKYTKKLASISWLDDYEAWNWGDDIDIDFSDEDMNYVEGLKNDVKESSGIFLQATASTHIFCVAALEAHINKIANNLLIKK